jgi:hypothetical protein
MLTFSIHDWWAEFNQFVLHAVVGFDWPWFSCLRRNDVSIFQIKCWWKIFPCLYPDRSNCPPPIRQSQIFSWLTVNCSRDHKLQSNEGVMILSPSYQGRFINRWKSWSKKIEPLSKRQLRKLYSCPSWGLREGLDKLLRIYKLVRFTGFYHNQFGKR